MILFAAALSSVVPETWGDYAGGQFRLASEFPAMEFESIFGRSANSVLGTVYGADFYIFLASWSLFWLFVAAAPFVLKSVGRYGRS